MIAIRTLLPLSLVVVAVAACAPTKRATVSETDYSGFLGDYSILSKGEEAALEYRRPDVPPGTYTKILLDPVTVWRGRESKSRGISQADAQRLADLFYTLAYDRLSQDYEIVQEPAPRTMRIGVALTKLDESNVALDVISNVVPVGRALSRAREVATGKPSFVGEAVIESRFTDAETGELLAAGVDRRVGGKTLSASSFNSWGDVETIFEFWVDRLAYRLCEAREDDDCTPPSWRRAARP